MAHPINRPHHHTLAEGALPPIEAAREIRYQARRIGKLAIMFGVEVPDYLRRAMHVATKDIRSMQWTHGFTREELSELADNELQHLLRRHSNEN
jgi:hypothetical protein